jgi:hypothetical protein
LRIVVYDRCCRIGGTLTLDDLAETSEIGDWKMPAFKMACTHAASQGWLIVEDDTLTLTIAGLAAAYGDWAEAVHLSESDRLRHSDQPSSFCHRRLLCRQRRKLPQ